MTTGILWMICINFGITIGLTYEMLKIKKSLQK